MSIHYQDVFDGLIKALMPKDAPFHWTLIKAMMKQESMFNPLAQSPVGARGLMQLMPKTDSWLDNEDDGFDVYGNVKDGIEYVRRLFAYWQNKGIGEPELTKFVLASYNAGQGNVGKALGSSPIKTWDYIRFTLEKVTGPAHSRETVNYVTNIVRFANEYNPPEVLNA